MWSPAKVEIFGDRMVSNEQGRKRNRAYKVVAVVVIDMASHPDLDFIVTGSSGSLQEVFR